MLVYFVILDVMVLKDLINHAAGKKSRSINIAFNLTNY